MALLAPKLHLDVDVALRLWKESAGNGKHRTSALGLFNVKESIPVDVMQALQFQQPAAGAQGRGTPTAARAAAAHVLWRALLGWQRVAIVVV